MKIGLIPVAFIFLLMSCSPTSKLKISLISTNQVSKYVPCCKIDYTIPRGMELDKMRTATNNSIAILVDAQKLNGVTLIIDYDPFYDKITNFEQFNKSQLEFLEKYEIYPDIVLEQLPDFISNSLPDSRLERWTTSNNQSAIYKKVLRLKLKDGFYSISINGSAFSELDSPVFFELLKSLKVECK